MLNDSLLSKWNRRGWLGGQFTCSRPGRKSCSVEVRVGLGCNKKSEHLKNLKLKGYYFPAHATCPSLTITVMKWGLMGTLSWYMKKQGKMHDMHNLDLISPDKGNPIQFQCGREVYEPRDILGILNGRTIMNFATHTRQLSGLLYFPRDCGSTRCR